MAAHKHRVTTPSLPLHNKARRHLNGRVLSGLSSPSFRSVPRTFCSAMSILKRDGNPRQSAQYNLGENLPLEKKKRKEKYEQSSLGFKLTRRSEAKKTMTASSNPSTEQAGR